MELTSVNNTQQVPADADVTTSHGIALTQCAQKIKDLSSSLATEHRDLHGTVSKVGKAIDKNFVPDFWATSSEEHELQGTALHFQLHRLHLVGLLQRGAAAEAIAYARAHLAPLARQHERDLQVLMGSLAFLRVPGGLARSPYAFLLEPALWSDTCEAFTRDACALLGLSVRSPLAVCVEAGSLALPALLNIKQVMMQRQVAGVWSTRDELPIEIRLGCQFHSVFACPILRQQSSDANPPMRLVCGHVISRDALHKLASGSKLKCPYCPVEQNPSDARLIHF
ncbi:hypothetical protein HPB52_001075 [Rhipicephalus sanguineus]|uniref:RING-Gid-type domain-containing protein n=1 Tax=Rhipicephalus sanguineus TaxID=34632 RepID=A0A9D4QJ95_RHISA|nr:hypothetical protein HPB52_001075 [Rhipicephalus sanguineus]